MLFNQCISEVNVSDSIVTVSDSIVTVSDSIVTVSDSIVTVSDSIVTVSCAYSPFIMLLICQRKGFSNLSQYLTHLFLPL